jgi:hypothetical protein
MPLDNLKEYHQRYKVCEEHLKTPYIIRDGQQVGGRMLGELRRRTLGGACAPAASCPGQPGIACALRGAHAWAGDPGLGPPAALCGPLAPPFLD